MYIEDNILIADSYTNIHQYFMIFVAQLCWFWRPPSSPLEAPSLCTVQLANVLQGAQNELVEVQNVTEIPRFSGEMLREHSWNIRGCPRSWEYPAGW